MTRILRGACALGIAVAMGVGGPAFAAGGKETTAKLAVGASESGKVQQASCDECGDVGCECAEPCDCGEACGDGCGCGVGGGLGLAGGGAGRGQFFVGGEYLSVRSSFSEATAYRRIDLGDNTETLEQFDFNYGGSFRAYAGYRLCECGGEIRFTYTSFDTDGEFNSGALDNNGQTVSIESPYEVVAPGNGDSLSGTADTNVDIYDIAFAKTIPLGSPLGCATDCCDPCGGYCPAWDLQFIGGIRVANVDSRLSYASQTPSSTIVPDRTAESTVSFDGVGLRGGFLGRRYIGRSGMASVYVRGDISLLLGDVDYTANGTVFPRTSISTTEVIPVTDLEAGATMFLTPKLSVTGGYLLSAWHDLGHRAEYDYSVTGTQLVSMDDANMMMFDGFFVRGELAF
ncbi:MAG: hypothetical protein ACRCT8_16870 [Lacipirellulaceae bacterium]